jgi:hypothetical protein
MAFVTVFVLPPPRTVKVLYQPTICFQGMPSIAAYSCSMGSGLSESSQHDILASMEQIRTFSEGFLATDEVLIGRNLVNSRLDVVSCAVLELFHHPFRTEVDVHTRANIAIIWKISKRSGCFLDLAMVPQTIVWVRSLALSECFESTIGFDYIGRTSDRRIYSQQELDILSSRPYTTCP